MPKRRNAAAGNLFHSPPDLAAELARLMRQIPIGKVATCGGLARALGHIAAARWIGTYLRHHRHDDDCPCHRVVLSTGNLGGYVGDLAEKAVRLNAEKVAVTDDAVDLHAHQFDSFRGIRPLAELAEQQAEIKKHVRLERLKMPRLAAGVDVSYGTGGTATAAYALVDVKTGELIGQTIIERKVEFPYISSFLAFRELPPLLDVLQAARRDGLAEDVVLVDGAGVMHPRAAGVASQLGVVANVATIGVTKKLLFGTFDATDMQPGEQREVTHEDHRLGVAIRHRTISKRPLYVSPGHGCDVESSARIVKKLLLGRALVEPIYWADRLSRRAAKKKCQ